MLQIRAVEFAGKYGVPLRVLHSVEEGPGTLITYENEGDSMEDAVISGIAFNRDEAELTIAGVPDHPGIAYQILGPIGKANIEVDMIIQNVAADGCTDFTFTVHRNEYQKALKILKKTSQELGPNWTRCVTKQDAQNMRILLRQKGAHQNADKLRQM